MPPTIKFAACLLLIIAMWSAQVIEGKSTAGLRESKQLFLIPSGSYQQPEYNPYIYPAPASVGESTLSGRLFGIFGGQRPSSCPTCPTCQQCTTTTCAACPPAATPCAALTTPSPLISITFGAGVCTTTANGATSYGPCTKSTAAPSGSFVVTTNPAAAAADRATAFIAIVPTCPNTKVSLTCGIIPAGITVITQSGLLATGATTADSKVTENNSMQVVVQTTAAAVIQSTVTCSWVSS